MVTLLVLALSVVALHSHEPLSERGILREVAGQLRVTLIHVIGQEVQVAPQLRHVHVHPPAVLFRRRVPGDLLLPHPVEEPLLLHAAEINPPVPERAVVPTRLQRTSVPLPLWGFLVFLIREGVPDLGSPDDSFFIGGNVRRIIVFLFMRSFPGLSVSLRGAEELRGRAGGLRHVPEAIVGLFLVHHAARVLQAPVQVRLVQSKVPHHVMRVQFQLLVPVVRAIRVNKKLDVRIRLVDLLVLPGTDSHNLIETTTHSAPP